MHRTADDSIVVVSDSDGGRKMNEGMFKSDVGEIWQVLALNS